MRSHLDRRHEFGDAAGELGLDHGRRAEGKAVCGAARDRGDDIRMACPRIIGPQEPT